jgi:hypothetical protein
MQENRLTDTLLKVFLPVANCNKNSHISFYFPLIKQLFKNKLFGVLKMLKKKKPSTFRYSVIALSFIPSFYFSG